MLLHVSSQIRKGKGTDKTTDRAEPQIRYLPFAL
jgi:hypothetical protein